MKKIIRLKICDWSLLILAVAILVSGIQLETTHSTGLTSVWIHIAVGILFMGMATYHIFLHFGYSNWFTKINKQKSPVTRILWWISLITLITGIIALAHWLTTFTHAPIGGAHGKSGFLMILLSSGHIINRIKFFKRRQVPRISAMKKAHQP